MKHNVELLTVFSEFIQKTLLQESEFTLIIAYMKLNFTKFSDFIDFLFYFIIMFHFK